MSLILDALRKADSEREREAVPSLHAQPVPSMSAVAVARPGAQAWRWLPLGIAIGALVPAAWLLASRDAPRVATELAAPATAPVVATASAASAAPAPVASAVPAPATAAAPVTSAPPAPPVAITDAAPPASESRPGRADAQPVAEPAPWSAQDSRRSSVGSSEATRSPEKAGSRAETPVVASAAVEAPIYSREQLPPDIRAGLPNLVVGGSIYSPSPAARSVIINGRIYRENDALNQELVLEQIKLKAAVLRYKGYRFEIGF